MNDNVVNFNDALKKAEQQEQEHEHVCSHCEDKQFHMETFFNELLHHTEKSGGVLFDALFELLDTFYDIVHAQGKTDALEDIMEYASFKAYGDED